MIPFVYDDGGRAAAGFKGEAGDCVTRASSGGPMSQQRDKYWLSRGSHADPKDGRCALEWISYLAGEPHSDKPVCVSPLLREFCVQLNDVLDDEMRQRLRPYLARTIGTAGDGLDDARAWMATDWIVRVYTPTWLALCPALRGQAEMLRTIPPIRDSESLSSATGPLAAAGAAAWVAAEDAARAADWDATWDVAGDAAWAAARVAARAVARVAAWAAARAADWDAARAAAVGAARAAAGAAAWVAAWDAAWDALVPTVKALQVSALDLLDRMLPLEPVQTPACEVRWEPVEAA